MNVDIAIVGAGAAGLATAIFAAEAGAQQGLTIAVFDGARKPGAKILVSGGGRCNVTNERVTEADYCGGPAPLVKRVLRTFGVEDTLAWMRALGVGLKLEPTGKYFPTTDSARTVLDALLRRMAEVAVRLHAGARVVDVAREGEGFALHLADGTVIAARRLVMATGGLALPKSGSDGWGLAAVRRLGHAIIPTTPALVPMVLRAEGAAGLAGRFAELSGLAFPLRVATTDPTGRVHAATTGPLLWTHFGISGPAALDISRHWLRERHDAPDQPAPGLAVGLPEFERPDDADTWLLKQASAAPRRRIASALSDLAPERWALGLVQHASLEDDAPFAAMTREHRRALATAMARLPLNVAGDRGYSFAETTAGGVDLREIDTRTMASRRVPGLYLVGEMIDVDGRLGGFNFQWAWASGFVAGRAVAASLEG